MNQRPRGWPSPVWWATVSAGVVSVLLVGLGVWLEYERDWSFLDIVTDAQGNITKDSDFYPWGGELQFVNNDKNDYLFGGHKRDTETGLDYFGARYYSNGLGRFITPDWSATPAPVPYADPSDPQTLNQYGYVRNIPTSKADLDGHCYPFAGC